MRPSDLEANDWPKELEANDWPSDLEANDWPKLLAMKLLNNSINVFY